MTRRRRRRDPRIAEGRRGGLRSAGGGVRRTQIKNNEGVAVTEYLRAAADVKTTRTGINRMRERVHVQRANTVPDALMPRAAATYGCVLASRIANQGKSCESA